MCRACEPGDPVDGAAGGLLGGVPHGTPEQHTLGGMCEAARGFPSALWAVLLVLCVPCPAFHSSCVFGSFIMSSVSLRGTQRAPGSLSFWVLKGFGFTRTNVSISPGTPAAWQRQLTALARVGWRGAP